MADRPSIPRSQVRTPSVTGLLYLYEVVIGHREVLRLTSCPTGPISFDGQAYHSHPIEIEGLGWQPGQLSHQPQMRLSLTQLPDADEVLDDASAGGSVTRLITFDTECDAPLGEGHGGCFPPETWQIDRLSHLDGEQVQFALAPIADLADATLPNRIILRDICGHRYRQWDAEAQRFSYQDVTCPYVGNRYYDATGAPRAHPSQDVCSLRLSSGCRKRFHHDLPFMGFPGLAP